MKSFLKYKTWVNEKDEHQRGATAVLVAIMIVVLLGFAALAIDIGYLMASKNEAQNVADASALAACSELGEQHYQEIDSIDEDKIRNIAKNVAGKNDIAGEAITISNDSDIEIGYWDPETKTFSMTPIGVLHKKNCVRVTARRDDSENGPISSFFAKVLGIDSFSVSADATAALTGLSKMKEGELVIPVGISKYWFHYAWEDEFCDQPIKFHPTGTIDGCAGWHTFLEKSNASKLKEIITGVTPEPPTYITPEVTSGSTLLEFIGGDVASVFDEMEALYDAKKDSDGIWKTAVVIYDYDGCDNPKQEIKIVGFATAEIYEVVGPPDKQINAKIICDEYEDERGGGGLYGTYGKIPNLVE